MSDAARVFHASRLKKLTAVWKVIRTAGVWVRGKEFRSGFLPVFIGAGLAIGTGLIVDRTGKEWDRRAKEKVVLPQILCELTLDRDRLEGIIKRDAHPVAPIPYRPIRATAWDSATRSGQLESVKELDLVARIARAYAVIDEVNGLIVRYADFYYSPAARSGQDTLARFEYLLDVLRAAATEARNTAENTIKAIEERTGSGVCG